MYPEQEAFLANFSSALFATEETVQIITVLGEERNIDVLVNI